MNEALEAAKFYLSGGFSVVPVQVGGVEGKKDLKFPVVWQEYQTKRPTEAELEAWWKKWPDADVAIVTGKISGISVVDTEKGADLGLFGLRDSTTVSSVSGGGGRHFYFAYTDRVKNRVKFAPLHDIRNDGGVIIAPPSKHPSGSKYAWQVPLGLATIQPFPLNIIKAFEEAGGMKSVDWAKRMTEEIGEGSRNDTMTSIAGKMLQKHDEKDWESVVWPMLVSWNATMVVPPLSEQEVRNIFRSIGGAEIRRRRTGAKVGEAVINKENDVFVVRIPIEEGFAVFSFDEPTYSRGDLEAIVKCHVEIPGHAKRVFESRLNVLSGSSCESYARQLTASFGKEIKWPLILSEAGAKFKEAYRESASDDIVNSTEIFPETPTHLLAPFIEEGAANLLFAKGGIGKTYLSLRWAMSLACGSEFLGSLPIKTVKTLFIDYENSPGTFKYRILNLAPFCEGFNKEAESMLFYKNSGGIPLFEMKDSLRRFVVENNIGLVIVDSAAPACGGPPEDAAVATRYFAALRHIGVTSLTIGHEAKADSGEWTFGSVFFTNLARNIWNMKSESEEGDHVKHLGLTHKKFNNGPLSRPVAIKMTDQGLGIEYAEDLAYAGAKDSKSMILSALKEDEDTSLQQLYGILPALGSSTVRAHIAKLAETKRIRPGEKRGSWRIEPKEDRKQTWQEK